MALVGGGMRIFFVIITWLLVVAAGHAQQFSNPELTSHIEALFSGDRNLTDVKFAIDKIVQPSLNSGAAAENIDRMAGELARISAGAATASPCLFSSSSSANASASR